MRYSVKETFCVLPGSRKDVSIICLGRSNLSVLKRVMVSQVCAVPYNGLVIWMIKICRCMPVVFLHPGIR
jgi:hypothetical protein